MKSELVWTAWTPIFLEPLNRFVTDNSGVFPVEGGQDEESED